MPTKFNQANHAALKAELTLMKKRMLIAGNFTVILLLFTALFAFFLKKLTNLTLIAGTAFHITASSMLLLLLIFLILAKKTEYHASFFGFTLKHWQRALAEAILFTIPILVLMTLIKWCIIHYVSNYSNLELFAFGHLTILRGNIAHHTTFLMLFFYLFISSPIQEIIFRGGIQSTLQFILINKHKNILANITSSILFAMIHLILSNLLACFALITGLFWGWLYQRQKTLLGACVSHIIIGSWSFFILGVQDLIF